MNLQLSYFTIVYLQQKDPVRGAKFHEKYSPNTGNAICSHWCGRII